MPKASARASFSIVNKTRGLVPPVPFEKIKNAVLGNAYELSLALLTPAQARTVTKKTKHIDTASNVLSFELSKQSGEILICPATARLQAKEYGLTYEKFFVRLFIHGLLHLNGVAHGDTMDTEERRIAKRFGFLL